MEVSLTGSGGNLVSREQTSSSESSSSVMEKDIGNTHVLAKENSFSAEQTSRMVSESVTSSSSCVVSKKVSSTSVVSSSVTSSSESSLSQEESPSGVDVGPCVGADQLPPVPEEPPVTEQEEPKVPEGEIPQESIKEALKEIISEIEEAVVEETPENQQPLPSATSEPMVINGTDTPSVNGNSCPVETLEKASDGGVPAQSEAEGAEPQGGGRLDRQTSTTSLAEFASSKQEEPEDISPLRKLFPSLFKGPGSQRPVSLPSATDLVHLWQSLQIAQELNTVLQESPEETKEETTQTTSG